MLLVSAKHLPSVVGISRATAYRLLRERRFPAPVRVSPGRVAWRHADLEAWVSSLGTSGESQ